MPNWCHSHIIATGPQKTLMHFRNRCFVHNKQADNVEFSFDTIIPTPKVFMGNLLHGPDDALCLVAVGADPGKIIGKPLDLIDALARDRVRAAGITSREELLAYLEANEPAALDAARNRHEAFRQTGYSDRLYWRIVNWGSKWDAWMTKVDVVQDGYMEFRFANPWNFPEPVFLKLGELYSDLRFEIVAIDPDCGDGVAGLVAGDEDTLMPISDDELPEYARSSFGWTYDEDEPVN